jgi:hypothetical protein
MKRTRSGQASNAWLQASLLAALLMLPPAYGQDATQVTQVTQAEGLKAIHAELAEQLASNQFQRPLHLRSKQSAEDLQGDIYAVLTQPFSLVGPALQGSQHWCDILILHLNVKSCRVLSRNNAEVLSIHIGRKFEQPLADTYLFEFAYQVAASTPDFLQVRLTAADGPMSTHNYRIALQVVALDAERSFLHLSYSYAYGMSASLAMQGYLSTTGRAKVGFSILEHDADGEPRYIGGMRGVVERNTMRYYLAIEAYLSALSAPPSEQVEKRLAHWQSGVERYPRQLHELDRAQYLAIKREEIQRQKKPTTAPALD